MEVANASKHLSNMGWVGLVYLTWLEAKYDYIYIYISDIITRHFSFNINRDNVFYVSFGLIKLILI